MKRARQLAIALGVATVLGCRMHAERKPERVALREWCELQAAKAGPRHPGEAARAIEARLGESCDAETLLVLADLCFRAAHQSAEASPAARSWYRDAAVYAAFALAAAETTDAFCRASEIHNHSLEHLIRTSEQWRVRRGRTWQQSYDDLSIELDGPAFLDPQRFKDLEIAQDYKVWNVDAMYRNPGVGVPVIAFRPNDRMQPEVPADRYFSYDINAAATAVLHPRGTPCDWRNHAAVLYLHDPFESRCIDLAGRRVTLASDRTTPLAVQEQFSSLEALRRVGFLRPDALRAPLRGLYMYQPYRPGKIPIVLVHGIYSSPSTWSQTVNELQNDPEIAEHYQIWLFLYPTGAPLTVSAADLRRTLREAIEFFDPQGCDPALRHMVLIGHSMGGLISKMIVMDSGDALWRAYFDRPFEEVRAKPEVKERLRETLFLTPEPYIDRLVMIATPHRGSFEACCFPGQLLQVIMHRPQELRDTIRDVVRENGKQVAAPGVRTRPLNGVGGLSPQDPALAALLNIPIAVPYDSIIPQITILGHRFYTDGIVRYSSSHLDGAQSETITEGYHTSHDSAAVTRTLERILRQHAAECLPLAGAAPGIVKNPVIAVTPSSQHR